MPRCSPSCCCSTPSGSPSSPPTSGALSLHPLTCITTFLTCMATFLTCMVTFLTCMATFLTSMATFLTCITTFLTCMATFLACMAAFLTCMATFLTCMATFLTCMATFLTCMATFLTCMATFLTCMATFPSQSTRPRALSLVCPLHACLVIMLGLPSLPHLSLLSLSQTPLHCTAPHRSTELTSPWRQQPLVALAVLLELTCHSLTFALRLLSALLWLQVILLVPSGARPAAFRGGTAVPSSEVHAYLPAYDSLGPYHAAASATPDLSHTAGRERAVSDEFLGSSIFHPSAFATLFQSDHLLNYLSELPNYLCEDGSSSAPNSLDSSYGAQPVVAGGDDNEVRG
ncbi:unnamed protein product [Closterium sp. Naga37s-1]|nr:unnamed protein product [Closterium sp. Naga37s-1]